MDIIVSLFICKKKKKKAPFFNLLTKKKSGNLKILRF